MVQHGHFILQFSKRGKGSFGFEKDSINPVNDTVNDTNALSVNQTQLKIV